MLSDRLDHYIESHPKESLKLLTIGLVLIWQTVPAILGLVCYFLFKKYKIKYFVSFISGGILLLAEIFFLKVNFISYLQMGFHQNVNFWKCIFGMGAFHYAVWLDFAGIPFLLAGLLDIIDYLPESPHKKTMKELQHGLEINSKELCNKKVDAALKKLCDEQYDGVLLGVSKYTGKPLIIPDKDINQVVLVLGTTGAGKTITLRRFYKRAILKNYPLIIVDGKPDIGNIEWARRLAEQYDRQFIGFNCGNYLPYDPLANGGFTELKDKIISLKDEWSSDYYRSIAEDYLQTTLEVLLKSQKEFDLRKVVECLNYENLGLLVREIKDAELEKKVNSLEHYNRQDITGLQAHLNILIHSELGQFFEKNATTFTLPEAIQQNAVVYFALPALRFPSFSKVLGKLVINDLKAVIDSNSNNKKILTIFDEFSVFAGEQVLNLVNMGREKGVHAIFGTQGLADLDRVDVNFKNQVMNCVNTLICHRLNDQVSAETVARWIGTKDAFTVTAQLDMKQHDAAMGSVRLNKQFIIHPDAVKQELQVGEIFYITKVNKFWWEKAKIKFN